MSFLNRFRSPEERERREREKSERQEQRWREQREREAAAQLERERRAAQAAAEAAERARAYAVEVLGPDLAAMEVNTPAEAKIAIKLARLRKKELQAEKREISSELADHREEWRDRTAGRYSTIALGRGTGARIVRAGIQGKRRAERQEHAKVVNQFSDAKQAIDRKIAVVDRMILEFERIALGR